MWLQIIKKADSCSNEKESSNQIFKFFLFGLLTIPLTDFSGFILYSLFDTLFSVNWIYNAVLYEFIAVGVLEESVKFFVFFVFAVGTNAVKEPKDGILLGAAVALAFAVLENIIYSRFGAEILLFRSMITAAGHMSLAAVWGYFSGVIIYFYRISGSKKIKSEDMMLLFYSIMFASLLHTLGNILVFKYSLLLDTAVAVSALTALSFLNKKSPYRKVPYSRNEEAITNLKMVLKINPGNFEMNKEAALHYMRACSFRKSLSHLKTALRARPGDLEVLLYLKVIMVITGDAEKAYLEAEKLLMKTELKFLLAVYGETKKVLEYPYHRLIVSDFFDKLIRRKREIKRIERGVPVRRNPVKEKVEIRYARPVPYRTAFKYR